MNDQLLISFIYKQKTGLLVGKQDWPVQGILFKYGFLIKNITNKPFLGTTIKNIVFDHKETGLSIGSAKKVAIPELNPNEETSLWVEPYTTYLCGNIWCSFELEIKEEGQIIRTHQVIDKVSGVEAIYEKENMWGKHLFIIPKTELLQARTNYLIAILTIILFLDAIIGLDVIFIFLLEQVKLILRFILELLG